MDRGRGCRGGDQWRRCPHLPACRLVAAWTGSSQVPLETGVTVEGRLTEPGQPRHQGGNVTGGESRGTGTAVGFLPHVSSKPGIATKKRSILSDVHQRPPRPSARRQDLGNRGRDHHRSLYSRGARPGRRPCGRCENHKSFHSRARGFDVISQGGICGFFRKPR